VRLRLLRGIAAVGVAIAMTMGAAAQPALAADTDDYSDVFVDVLSSLLSKVEDGSISPSEVLALVQELKGAIKGVETDVIARLDSLVVRDVKNAAEAGFAKTEFLNNRITAATYANDAINGAVAAKSAIDVVSSDHDLDAVGRALMTLYTMADVGFEKFGSNPQVRATRFRQYREGLQKLIDKMAPHCDEFFQPQTGYRLYRCTYNGKTVRGEQLPDGFSLDGQPPVPGVIDRQLIQDLTMADTAEKLAKDTLEVLRQRGY
jgi:hypothetical protein